MKIKVGNGNKEVDVLALLSCFFYICYRCSIDSKVLSYSLAFQWFITAQAKTSATLSIQRIKELGASQRCPVFICLLQFVLSVSAFTSEYSFTFLVSR